MSSSSGHALALDFGRVLTLDPEKAPFDGLVTRAGLDPAAFRSAYAAHRLEYDRGTLDALGYWTLVFDACRPGIQTSEVEFYLSSLIDADFFSWAQPRAGLHQLIQSALAHGVPTAIVSNMPRGIGPRFLETWPWLAQIDHRFFSAEFGLVKPDARFYQHVLETTGWRASEVLFVDDLAANVAMAANLGFSTLLFTGSAADLAAISRWCGLV